MLTAVGLFPPLSLPPLLLLLLLQVVRFCSPACHKAAWKSGHKAACAVLQQHQQQQRSGGVAETAAVAAER